MPDIPEHILRRSAEARAKAEGRTVEEVLAEMKGEEPPDGSAPEPEEAPAAEAPAAAAPPPAPPQAGRGGGAALPEALLRRSAEARARAEGRPVEEVLAEMKGERGVAEPAAPAEQPAAQQPAAPQPAVEAPAAETPAAQPAAEAPARPAGGGDDRYKELEEAGIPQVLIERSKQAMAKAKGEPVGAGATPAPGGGETAPVRAATAAAPATAPAAPAVPEGVRTQRLLTVVKAKAIQQVKTEPTDKVNTWPHLVAIEFVALLVVTAAITVFSIWVDAPLLEFANFNEQPNPSKAPWYFLGLQELLGYFDPQVAGVLIPGLGLGALAIIPYIDRNPSVRPADRKLAIMIFSFFIFAAAVLTIYGSFFRGPGFNFTFPWTDGLFFDF